MPRGLGGSIIQIGLLLSAPAVVQGMGLVSEPPPMRPGNKPPPPIPKNILGVYTPIVPDYSYRRDADSRPIEEATPNAEGSVAQAEASVRPTEPRTRQVLPRQSPRPLTDNRTPTPRTDEARGEAVLLALLIALYMARLRSHRDGR